MRRTGDSATGAALDSRDAAAADSRAGGALRAEGREGWTVHGFVRPQFARRNIAPKSGGHVWGQDLAEVHWKLYQATQW